MSRDCVIDRRGSPLCVAPLERHEFAGNGFECSVCHRPRAMHRTGEFHTIPSNIDPGLARIRSVSFSMALRGKLLTDKVIEKYEDQGYYSEEFREARRAHWERRKSNFRVHDGRMIYCP